MPRGQCARRVIRRLSRARRGRPHQGAHRPSASGRRASPLPAGPCSRIGRRPRSRTPSSAGSRRKPPRPAGYEAAPKPPGSGTSATGTSSRDRCRTCAPGLGSRRGSRRTSARRSGTLGGSRRRAFHTYCAPRSSRDRSGSEGLQRATSVGRRPERARIPRSRRGRRCALPDYVANAAHLPRARGQPASLRARLGATRGGSSGCFG